MSSSIKDPCDNVKIMDVQLKEMNVERRKQIEKCNDTKYWKSAEQPDTMIQLLQLIYITPEFEDCNKLFEKFPETSERTSNLKTKPYIFEALWKIIFLLYLDNLTPVEYSRVFKVSIELGEAYESRYNYLNSKINSGSSSGIADLYFILKSRTTKDKHTSSNEIKSECEKQLYKPDIKDAYLFTSKYFKDEHAIGHYDVAEIVINAEKVHKNNSDGSKGYKIVCLVRNRAEFVKKIESSTKEALKEYINSNLIYDYGDLATIFYPKLYKWLNANFTLDNIDDVNGHWKTILDIVPNPSNNVLDILRFHQRYVVEYTNDRITQNLIGALMIDSKTTDSKTSNPGKFIWGAVARSGKSYMIGGLVALRKPKFVILVLGAVNETRSQFIDDLFKKYSDLQKYTVLDEELKIPNYEFDFDNADNEDTKHKYVIVVSQESIRTKVSSLVNANANITNPVINTSVIDNIMTILKYEDKIIFFDEIHQGSSKDEPLQKYVIEFFFRDILNHSIIYPKPLLILVSATYAKPYKRYGQQFEADDSKTNCTLVEWTYEMIMKMKQFTPEMVGISTSGNADAFTKQPIAKPLIAEPMVDVDSYDYVKKMEKLKEITDKLIRNGKTYEDIAAEYSVYPELKYLLPTLKENNTCEGIHIDENYDVDDENGAKLNIRNNLVKVFELENRSSKKVAEDIKKCNTSCDAEYELKEDNELCKYNCGFNAFAAFKHKTAVNKVLWYISNYVYDELLGGNYGFNATGSGEIHSQLWFLPTTMKNSNFKKQQTREEEGDGEGDGDEDEDEDGDEDGDGEEKYVESANKRKPNTTSPIIAPLMRNLANLIVNHPKFSNFNVCVVHSMGDLPSKYYDTIENTETGTKVFFNCIKRNKISKADANADVASGKKYKSVKECIVDIENESRKNDKSLIILTAQRLRLGISLPCVDVAIHMDNIVSYDTLYQTMFRVLTDRKKKERGYFVDMIYNRGIEFIYKYARAKKNGDIKKVSRDVIKAVMYDFDAGLIRSSFKFSSVETPINSYGEVAKAFHVSGTDDDPDSNSRKKLLTDIDKDQQIDENGKVELPAKIVVVPVKKSRLAPEEDAILALVSNYKKQIADIIRGYAVQISDSSTTISESENTLPHKKDYHETVLKKPSRKPENPDKIEEDINIKSVIEHIKNIFTMILLFDDADASNDGVHLEHVIDSSSYIDEKIDEIKKCKKNDKLIYCYLAGIQDSLKIGDRLQKKTQIFKRKSQVIRKIDNAVGEITRKRQNKEVVIFDDADDEDEEDSADDEDEEDSADDGFRYSVKWEDGTESKSILSRQLMKEIKPILGRIVGITSVCRDLKNCLTKDEKIRHKIGNDIREGIYDGNNKIQFGDVKTTLNQFTINHYLDVSPERHSSNNAWDTCEIFRNGVWISMFNLRGKSYVNIYNVKWDNNEKPEQYNSLKSLEKNAIQLSNAVAFDISQLEKREIREKIDRQFKIIRYLMTEVPDGKLVINNLYQYIKGNMDKNKQRLIGDSFNYVETGFCPTDFINNENVLEIIRKHLTPDKSTKNLFGEVFTPLKLVCEMLSHLPSNVWTNRDLKWFDPANGIGNFPIVVYYKLMQMLTGFKSEKAKSKHIIENMLYMNELNQINVGICKRIFKLIDASAEPNIYKSDFLASTKLGLSRLRFDVIIGNPPYNPPKTETGSSGNSIWQHFVIKSFYMLKEKGYLVFVHPPGWRKPTEEIFDPVKLDILGGQYYKAEKSVKQIRQGLVWQFLKENGIFSFIYTNDQRIKKTDEYIDHFPAIDYYVYKKGGAKDVLCDTKNVFFGVVKNGDDVKLKYDLKYLPNLITKQAMIILDKITSKAGDKPQFVRYRNGSGFSVDPSKGKYPYIYTYDKNSTPKYQYSNIASDNINLDKVIMNFDGGIDCYTIQYVKKEDLIGSYEMTMYSEVDTDKLGRCIVKFFKSDIVRFIFLITQYSSGQRTKNEPLVANSITIPPDDITDYYKFFGIESYKKYIEDILAHYESTKKKEKKGGFTKRNARSNRNAHTRRNNSK